MADSAGAVAHGVSDLIIDWGAGPGGWDVGAATLGLCPVGIEMGAAECQTRAAAGHLTIRADASTWPAETLYGRLWGFIGSTPCPDFSSAGKRAGLGGETGPLVYEVLRWAELARPRWIAVENVKEVAPIFRSFRAPLAARGYSVWSGVLDVADFGVPQNRRRAFLLASLDRAVGPPAPTHSKSGHDEMFGVGRLRWISMAEALGWDDDGRIVETQSGSAAESGNYFDPFAKPSRTICGARTPRWLYEDRDGTHGAVLRTGNNSTIVGNPYERSVDRPAPTVDGKAGTSHWKVETGNSTKGGARPGGLSRGIDEPARTVDSASGQWVLRTPGRSYDADPAVRSVAAPAPTVALGHNAAGWCWERPATTVQGTPRVAPPGHHVQQWADAVPVELWQLGVLQGFPADYPWRGNKTEQARQIGNAVCPPMARHLLAAVTGRV